MLTTLCDANVGIRDPIRHRSRFASVVKAMIAAYHWFYRHPKAHLLELFTLVRGPTLPSLDSKYGDAMEFPRFFGFLYIMLSISVKHPLWKPEAFVINQHRVPTPRQIKSHEILGTRNSKFDEVSHFGQEKCKCSCMVLESKPWRHSEFRYLMMTLTIGVTRNTGCQRVNCLGTAELTGASHKIYCVFLYWNISYSFDRKFVHKIMFWQLVHCVKRQ